MATKPIKFLELHYTMTQFLINVDIDGTEVKFQIDNSIDFLCHAAKFVPNLSTKCFKFKHFFKTAETYPQINS